jgi:hypothetical protein
MPPIRHNSGLMSGGTSAYAAGDLKCRMQSGGLSRFGFQETRMGNYLNTEDHVFSEFQGFGRKIVDLKFVKVILCMTKLEKGASWQTERRSKQHQSGRRTERLIIDNVLRVFNRL